MTQPTLISLPIRPKLTITVPPPNRDHKAHGDLGRHPRLSNNSNPPTSTSSIKMALRAEAYLTWASTSMSTAADSVLILTMRVVQVILTTRNYPGRRRLIPPAGSPTTSHIIKDFSQHMPTTVFPPNDNSLPQIRTLFAQLIPAIPALLPHLPPGHIHCSSTLPT
jgi:hypothetical protein